MYNKNQILLGTLIVIIAATAFLYYTNEDTTKIEGDVIQTTEINLPSESEPQSPAPETHEPTPEIKEFSITAKRFEFTPNPVIVNQGDQVKLIITSIDVTHGFFISEYGINERLKPGETVTVEFVADKKGEFSMICNVACGSGHGSMRGKLIVV